MQLCVLYIYSIFRSESESESELALLAILPNREFDSGLSPFSLLRLKNKTKIKKIVNKSFF